MVPISPYAPNQDWQLGGIDEIEEKRSPEIQYPTQFGYQGKTLQSCPIVRLLGSLSILEENTNTPDMSQLEFSIPCPCEYVYN